MEFLPPKEKPLTNGRERKFFLHLWEHEPNAIKPLKCRVKRTMTLMSFTVDDFSTAICRRLPSLICRRRLDCLDPLVRPYVKIGLFSEVALEESICLITISAVSHSVILWQLSQHCFMLDLADHRPSDPAILAYRRILLITRSGNLL